MIGDQSTFDLMRRWGCTRQAVSQIMKRYNVKPKVRTGSRSESIFYGEDVLRVESERQDWCRP